MDAPMSVCSIATLVVQGDDDGYEWGPRAPKRSIASDVMQLAQKRARGEVFVIQDAAKKEFLFKLAETTANVELYRDFTGVKSEAPKRECAAVVRAMHEKYMLFSPGVDDLKDSLLLTQQAMLRTIFAAGGRLDVETGGHASKFWCAVERLAEITSLLEEQALEGWDQDIQFTKQNGKEMYIRTGPPPKRGEFDDFDHAFAISFKAWCPFVVTHRALYHEGGTKVGCFMTDFKRDLKTKGQFPDLLEDLFESDAYKAVIGDQAGKWVKECGAKAQPQPCLYGRLSHPTSSRLPFEVYLSMKDKLRDLNLRIRSGGVLSEHEKKQWKRHSQQHLFYELVNDASKAFVDAYALLFDDDNRPIFDINKDMRMQRNGIFVISCSSCFKGRNPKTFEERSASILVTCLHDLLQHSDSALKDHNFENPVSEPKHLCSLKFGMSIDEKEDDVIGRLKTSPTTILLKRLIKVAELRFFALTARPESSEDKTRIKAKFFLHRPKEGNNHRVCATESKKTRSSASSSTDSEVLFLTHVDPSESLVRRNATRATEICRELAGVASNQLICIGDEDEEPFVDSSVANERAGLAALWLQPQARSLKVDIHAVLNDLRLHLNKCKSVCQSRAVQYGDLMASYKRNCDRVAIECNAVQGSSRAGLDSEALIQTLRHSKFIVEHGARKLSKSQAKEHLARLRAARTIVEKEQYAYEMVAKELDMLLAPMKKLFKEPPDKWAAVRGDLNSKINRFDKAMDLVNDYKRALEQNDRSTTFFDWTFYLLEYVSSITIPETNRSGVAYDYKEAGKCDERFMGCRLTENSVFNRVRGYFRIHTEIHSNISKSVKNIFNAALAWSGLLRAEGASCLFAAKHNRFQSYSIELILRYIDVAWANGHLFTTSDREAHKAFAEGTHEDCNTHAMSILQTDSGINIAISGKLPEFSRSSQPAWKTTTVLLQYATGLANITHSTDWINSAARTILPEQLAVGFGAGAPLFRIDETKRGAVLALCEEVFDSASCPKRFDWTFEELELTQDRLMFCMLFAPTSFHGNTGFIPYSNTAHRPDVKRAIWNIEYELGTVPDKLDYSFNMNIKPIRAYLKSLVQAQNESLVAVPGFRESPHEVGDEPETVQPLLCQPGQSDQSYHSSADAKRLRG